MRKSTPGTLNFLAKVVHSESCFPVNSIKMAIYLDSAILAEAEAASQWGWVAGVTTNPSLLAKSDLKLELIFQTLTTLFRGEIFYQLTATDFDTMIAEGKKVADLIGPQTVLKVPATLTGFQVVAHLSPDIACSVTAIYNPAQAVIAKEAGAKYAIVYVNRATRLLGDGYQLVEEMATLLQGSSTEVLAASIKSPEEAVETLLAGAHHLTLPFSLLQQMATHDLSIQTVEEFSQGGRGIWDSV